MLLAQRNAVLLRGNVRSSTTGTSRPPSPGRRQHAALTWFADAGVPVHVLRRIAGHGSLSTTQRYLHQDVRKITATGAALSARFNVLRTPRSLPGPVVMAR
ncbi:tyrosine-type recombinase/integrase [Streptomyces bacillaris]|uniref:tyrosine-type recombinase/integrase n=1 Tax=Streptomyces bacillaris TaxID=68179 RepID=UPI003690942D